MLVLAQMVNFMKPNQLISVFDDTVYVQLCTFCLLYIPYITRTFTFVFMEMCFDLMYDVYCVAILQLTFIMQLMITM